MVEEKKVVREINQNFIEGPKKISLLEILLIGKFFRKSQNQKDFSPASKKSFADLKGRVSKTRKSLEVRQLITGHWQLT